MVTRLICWCWNWFGGARSPEPEIASTAERAVFATTLALLPKIIVIGSRRRPAERIYPWRLAGFWLAMNKQFGQNDRFHREERGVRDDVMVGKIKRSCQ